ncbi:MAG: DNA-binding transcriptional LysR family regulator [Myxococcota bacterium]|jgi:DNA-binding transcriptional LysR family regulator
MKLEDGLGQTLIVRAGGAFELTPAGEALRAFGESRRREEAALIEALSDDDPRSGTVSLAASGSFANLLYPRLLPLLRDAPGLRLELIAAPAASIELGVKERRFHIGVLSHEPADLALSATFLAEEPLCLVLPASDTRPVRTLEDLNERGMIGHPDAGRYADCLLASCFGDAYRGAERLRVCSSVNQIHQITAPVAAGIGYAILPQSGVLSSLHRADLRIATLPGKGSQGLWLVRRKARPLPARAPT